MEDIEEVQPNPYESPTHSASAQIKKPAGGKAPWWWFAGGMTIAGAAFVSMRFIVLWNDMMIMGRGTDELIGAVVGLGIYAVIVVAMGLAGAGMWRGFRSQFFRKHRPRRIARTLGGLSFLPAHFASIVVLAFLGIPGNGVFTNVVAVVSVLLLSGVLCVEVEAKLALWFNL